MENLKIIEQREVLGQDFKIYGDYENPLFLAKDVAEWIEHSNSRMMLQSVDEDEKVVNNAYTLGGNQEQWFLTENGLYEVLMLSKKPIAKAFKSEVKKILKEIRLKGSYQRPMTQAEILAGQAQLLVEMERKANQAIELSEKANNRIDTALDVFTSPLGENWKDETNRKINTLCKLNGLPYQVFKGDLYAELEMVANCNISARQRNLKERLKKSGATYAERQAITKIDVIARDEKLKLIFDGIVKKYQAKYI
ncbi:MAG: Bro-N domain-containing protein [Oscillospiraceae bacterium]|jgi:prophage antirepressor-like protein